jgi:CheY-like chemotaxis protein
MKKILLASAYTVFLRRNMNLLLSWGFKLFSTTKGREALKLHEEHSFDLIVADFKLEDMCGCTLSSLIRSEEKGRPVPIIMACHNLPGSIERVEKCGATAMLIKPIAPINLIETIGSSLGMRLVRSKRVVLKVKVLSKISDLEFFCYSHNISNTGILLETNNHLILGSRIVCQFSLTDSCHIEAEGEIIRRMTGMEDNNLYGVKFIELAPDFRSAINNYISSIPFSGLREHSIKSGYIKSSANQPLQNQTLQ